MTVPRVFNSVIDWIKRFGPRILAAITGPIGLAVYFVVKYWDKIKAKTVAIFTGIADWIRSIWTSITTTIKDFASNYWSIVTGVWSRVGAAIRRH